MFPMECSRKSRRMATPRLRAAYELSHGPRKKEHFVKTNQTKAYPYGVVYYTVHSDFIKRLSLWTKTIIFT